MSERQAWLSRNALASFRASEAHTARLRAQVAQGMSRALLQQVGTPLQVWDKSRGQVAVFKEALSCRSYLSHPEIRHQCAWLVFSSLLFLVSPSVDWGKSPP